jgi:hypothetical protein
MRRVGACFLFAFVSVPLNYAAAGELPDIKIGASNAVPECVTPGRLLEFLKNRNPELNSRFDAVPVEYMRQGEKLGIRWDFAFYQMILETGSLSYRNGSRQGDVKPTQNNFAGLGATGRGEPGESFKDVATGVRAHLEHLLLYSGEKLENPTAERTRKVQEWGVLNNWQARFKRPITYADLAAQWAPGSGSYARMLDGIAERFQAFCERPDPRPELLAEVRASRGKPVAEAKPERPSGTQLAKRAIDDGKAEDNNQRSALGAPGTTGDAAAAAKAPPAPYKILNAPQETADAPAAAATAPAAAAPTPPAETGALKANDKPKAATASPPAAKPKAAAEKQPFQVASAAGAAKLVQPPAAPGQKCRVWTASYGGQKSLIIRSIVDKVVNYTVLDVNEGAEKREADAFISAYARDGAIAGEYGNQSQALDKAFELCPEG